MNNAPGQSVDAPAARTVHRLAGSLGFVMLGIAPAAPSRHEAFFLEWLAQGKHGQMEYLAQDIAQRLDPTQLVPDAKAIICIADQYNAQPQQPAAADAQGQLARYAWQPDYHRRIKKRLHALADSLREIWPEHTFRSVVDTAPVMEREHAQRAGLGWIGKHTLLIHPTIGSWFMLGQIITTLPLQPSAAAGQKIHADHCGQCTRCIDACPAQCISPYSVDASQCVSYLTIEHRDVIPVEQHASMRDWLAGCDVCQEVCPYNQSEEEAGSRASDGGHSGENSGGGMPRSFSLLGVLNWSPQARETALQRSALKRIKLGQFKRNALIAAGNLLMDQPGHAQGAALCERIVELAKDEAEESLVRQTAMQVMERLGISSAAAFHEGDEGGR